MHCIAFRKNILVIPVLAGLFFHARLQSQYLINPSLETQVETDDPNMIDGWDSDDTWADPDFFFSYRPPSPDTSLVYLPVDGKSFALFRARGANYISDNKHLPYTCEYLYQRLLKPLERNSCFKFDVSLCYNPYYLVSDFQLPDTAFPVKFLVWGGFTPNDRSQLLLETEPIANTSWKKFTFNFNTLEENYRYLLIEIQWDTVNVFPNAYNGHVMVDNLSLVNINETATHYTSYIGDNKTILIPDSVGISYSWEPKSFVSNPNSKYGLMTSFTDSMKVYIEREDNCAITEVFYIKPDCDLLYPNGELDTVDFYYKFTKGLRLTASAGVSWNWEPPIYLSSTNVQSPILSDYHEFYKVQIKDKYGCEIVENFHLIWNCDTLFPGGELIVLNKTLTREEDFNLVTFTGKPFSNWSPQNYLSCVECESPIASPRRSIIYSIEMIDEYTCIHKEKFIFNVTLKVPNVITPNGDDYNDCFVVMGLPENTTFYLFDKAGDSICSVPFFEELDCWDGGTENLKSGTYWYAFENPTEGIIAKGFILIIR
jgi:gliding motility-associated-like protein